MNNVDPQSLIQDLEEEKSSNDGLKIDDLDLDATTGNLENLEDTADILEDTKQDTKQDAEQDAKKEIDDFVNISKAKITIVNSLLSKIKQDSEKVLDILSIYSLDNDNKVAISQIGDSLKIDDGDVLDTKKESIQNDGQIVEGVFDGENMIGPDGKQYSIPANYASKSKLVEGDILKLTIAQNGAFIYKQIGPIERQRVMGKLEKADGGNFIVSNDKQSWKVLAASVSYYKGNIGEDAIILVPKIGDSQWAALDNVVHQE